MPDQFLTAPQAAERLGVSRYRIWQFCAAGRLPGAVKHGRDWLIPVAALAAVAGRRRTGRPKKQV